MDNIIKILIFTGLIFAYSGFGGCVQIIKVICTVPVIHNMSVHAKMWKLEKLAWSSLIYTTFADGYSYTTIFLIVILGNNWFVDTSNRTRCYG